MKLFINNLIFPNILFAVILVSFLLLGIVPPVTLLLVLVLSGVLSAYQYYLKNNSTLLFGILWLVSIIIGVVIGLYKPVDFAYPIVFSVQSLYEGGLPFSLTVNTGVACAGYCILWLMLPSPVQKHIFIINPKMQYGLSLLMALCVVSLAYFVLGLQIHIKEWIYIVYFALVNLLVTCVAEEAFMRVLLQAQLQQFISRIVSRNWIGELVALFIATLLFVFTHFTPTLELTLVYALAGFCYGLVYTLTKNIWASVLLHFLVNLVHFAFLTYPLI